MAEILLKCPKCGTEYRLPASAIPPVGREVECTVCNNSWFAQADEASVDGSAKPEVSSVDADIPLVSGVVRHEPSHSRASDKDDSAQSSAEIPPLRRRLPENILNILREEVEFERRARLAEKGEGQSADLPKSVGDDIWPATTITESTVAPEIPAAEDPVVQEAPLPPAPIQSVAPVVDIAPADKVEPIEKRRSGYFAGFAVALIAAVVALVMYLLPPDLAGSGSLGEGLSEYRQHVDSGRNWLQQKISGLVDGAGS